MQSPLLQSIRAQAEEHPARLAVSDGRTRLDYAALDRFSAAVADRLRARGVSPGDRVDIETVDPATAGGDGARRVAHGFRLIAYDIPRGCLASYFPETNVLVPLDSYGDKSFTPTSKSIPVTLSRSPAP